MAKLGILMMLVLLVRPVVSTAWGAEDANEHLPHEFEHEHEHETRDLSSWMVEGDEMAVHDVVMQELTNSEVPQANDPHWRTMVHAIFSPLVVENGLVTVREAEIPEWVNGDHFKHGVEQLNLHISNTIRHVVTASDLMGAMRSFDPPTYLIEAKNIMPLSMPMSGEWMGPMSGEWMGPMSSDIESISEREEVEVLQESQRLHPNDQRRAAPRAAVTPREPPGVVGAQMSAAAASADCTWGVVEAPYLCDRRGNISRTGDHICGYSEGTCHIFGGSVLFKITVHMERLYCPIEWVPGVPWNPCFIYDADTTVYSHLTSIFRWGKKETLVKVCTYNGRYRVSGRLCFYDNDDFACSEKASYWARYP